MQAKISCKGKRIADAKLITSLWGKAHGLMFSLRPRALIFVSDKEEYVSLHMFFVFFPIDVLYLDSKKRVVEMKKNFLPFALYNPKHKSRYVIELPRGTIDSHGLKDGDSLHF